MAVTPRFRMVAGPNGSGKTTLWHWLERDYAVNFYTAINAEYAGGTGLHLASPSEALPAWFRQHVQGIDTPSDGEC